MEIIPHECSEGSSSSLSSNDKKYDVFLSFRGIDTRNSFTAHLYKSLKEANIETFLDDEEIETGLKLKPELENAIKASRSSIIVLSDNYASSTWCLQELVLILQQNRISNHYVSPIFYNVEPTNIRKQEGSFGDAMAMYKQRMEKETNAEKKDELAHEIEIWGNALTEVADLKGKDAKNRRETELIEEIVTDIRLRLGVLLKRNLPDLIGMDDDVSFITSWLKDVTSHGTDILTILGMGGIGKTYLARYIYGLHCCLFQRSSFIANINRLCTEQSEKILDLQAQLLSDISKRSMVPVHDDSDYTSMIENALKDKKVLLVLDDVDGVEQLNKLLGNGGCHPGSKIIITTQVASLTKKFKTHKLTVQPKNTVHVLEGLNDKSSLQLLSLHASACNCLKAGYNEVSKKLVKYCEGHPGALEQMGKSLCDLGVAEWQEYIDLFNTEMNNLIKEVLHMDVKSLRSENDKELFKHIASFFAGKDRGFAETILKACKIKTQIGINNLTDRCLLKVGPRNELRMHQLLQDMGRDVVRQESAKPWKRSRLWCHEESYNALQRKKGKNLKGIAYDWRVHKEEESHESLELETDALSKMENLMLLQLNYVKLNGSYNNFPKQIRWLCMHGFPTQSIPSDLPMGNLVVLDMSYSCIESFDISNCNDMIIHGPRNREKLTGSSSKENLLLGSLKILNLSFCNRLRTLGGFSQLPMLEKLILASCRSLIEICETIGQCDDLLVIDLSYCNMLKRLPKSVFKLKKLEALSLHGCNLDEFLIDTTDKDLREILNFNIIRIDSQASSLWRLYREI